MALTRTQILLIGLVLLLGLSAAGWWASVGRLAVAGGPRAAMPVVAAVPAAQATAQAAPSPSGAVQPGGPADYLDVMPDGLVSAGWLGQTSVATGIPIRVLQAYAGAAIVVARTDPGCHLGWNTLAGIGQQESAHGTTGGASVGPDGQLQGRILGPVLDGGSYGQVPDTDQGRLDGDATWDRAVGPMQMLPSTWQKYGRDANGDGVADPNQIDDAVLSAGFYLCEDGRDLATASGWQNAIHSYNPNDAYLAAVRADANRYAKETGG